VLSIQCAGFKLTYDIDNKKGRILNFRIPVALYVFIITLALVFSGCASADTPPSPTSQKIIAIGDLHGDYGSYMELLAQARLIDKRGKWAGGETIFVQTGDVADRGPDSRKIIEHLQKLQKQARKKGGKVIALAGNHEAMNMTRDLRYVHAGEYAAFRTSKSRSVRAKTYKANQKVIEQFYLEKDRMLTADLIKENWEAANPLGKLEHQIQWSPKGDIGEWVAENPAVVIVDGILFVHGGVSEKYTVYSIDQMNAMTATALNNRNEDKGSIINDEWGPLWYRGLIPGWPRPQTDEIQAVPPLLPSQELEKVLTRFGATRMIVGHTPALQGIKTHYGGKLIQIDTGIAPYYGGTNSFLRIENGKLFAHDEGVIRELGPTTP